MQGAGDATSACRVFAEFRRTSFLISRHFVLSGDNQTDPQRTSDRRRRLAPPRTDGSTFRNHECGDDPNAAHVDQRTPQDNRMLVPSPLGYGKPRNVPSTPNQIQWDPARHSPRPVRRDRYAVHLRSENSVQVHVTYLLTPLLLSG